MFVCVFVCVHVGVCVCVCVYMCVCVCVCMCVCVWIWFILGLLIADPPQVCSLSKPQSPISLTQVRRGCSNQPSTTHTPHPPTPDREERGGMDDPESRAKA